MDILGSLACGFQSLFYLVPIQDYRTGIVIPEFIGSVLLLIFLESVFLRTRGKFRASFLISCFLVYLLQDVVNQVLERNYSGLAYHYTFEASFFKWTNNKYVLWFGCFLLYDFFFYLMHRFSHEINLVWQVMHSVHHAPQDMTIASALYQPIFQEDFIWIFFGIPGIFGLPPILWFSHGQLNTLYQIYIHTEAIEKLPWPIELVFNTPSHHRVHHGTSPAYIDKNYGGVLIIWDRIFGTFQEELQYEPRVYGLVEQVDSFNPLFIQFHNASKLTTKLINTSGFSNRMKVLFYGPGFDFRKPHLRLGDIADIPVMKNTGGIFDSHLSNAMTVYLTFQTLLVMVIYFTPIHSSSPNYLYKQALVLGSILILGFLLNGGGRWWKLVETIRVSLMVIITFHYILPAR